ncbi:MAG: A/G-specific adenine glycosylase [Roseiarcus sp.]|jgi:A/G-specific adenine glycosylase
MDDNVAPPGARLKPREIARRVLSWWDVHRRDLPWRAAKGEKPDPYRVWLSEILLQQTSATTAAPYFQKFVARWPRVEALAAASLDEVMSAFSGLGYYRRARNLHACAKEVARRGGRFPPGEAELRALPGIGAYTAAAVAAIACDAKAAPVDGNIARILARLHALETPIAETRRALRAAAAALTPTDRAGDFAQALMDIGALICRPRNPNCPACPLRGTCAAARTGEPDAYPRRASVRPKPKRVGAAFFARREDGAILARRRPPEGLLGATLELPGGPWDAAERAEIGPGQAPFAASWRRLPGEVEQAFTHFTLRLTLYAAEVGSNPPGAEGLVWIEPAMTKAAGFSSLMLKAVAHARRFVDAAAVDKRSYRRSRKHAS